MSSPNPNITVVGLGYVGLPLAVALAEHFSTIGFDISETRIEELRNGHDRTHEVDTESLNRTRLRLTADSDEAGKSDIFIVTVPTPVTEDNRPDLKPLLAATRTVGRMIDPERPAVVVYESTVYPGVTEDMCGPELEASSGLKRGQHFRLGYSPERINPGDREHRIDRIVKVVAGEDADVTELLAFIYGKVTSAGVYRAASIKAAEAAKVIENAQRDINIAFMNEIARIFRKLDISVWDVLDAAGTKWNFLKFEPGLVGGHCIGVDPFYLSHAAQAVGHDPEVILVGRRINDEMGSWVAGELYQAVGRAGQALVLGITFKENVPDIRNSKVVDVIRGLQSCGFDVDVHDPLADPAETREEYGITVETELPARVYDLILCAVPHDFYRDLPNEMIAERLAKAGVVADLKGAWRTRRFEPGTRTWSL